MYNLADSGRKHIKLHTREQSQMYSTKACTDKNTNKEINMYIQSK